MKIRLNLAATLSVLGIFCFSFAFGQDDRMPDPDYGGENKENRVINPSQDGINDLEIRNILRNPPGTPSTTSRDSVQIRTTPKKPETKSKTDENASVLNFNFLYYLIERFKLSDLVD
ncbi:MAG: hypothetical protein KF845_02665 [Cyclobacteriaceae bacterium]|nr:hypothetical protein [Cyclobacteriaceae bacterium]